MAIHLRLALSIAFRTALANVLSISCGDDLSITGRNQKNKNEHTDANSGWLYCCSQKQYTDCANNNTKTIPSRSLPRATIPLVVVG
eukprot:3136532-Lingulodinium_polyedra.AAC.1